MNKKKTTMLVIFLIGILTVVYTLASTYAVIIEVKDEEGRQEIINEITIRDLLTNEDGTYNTYYYRVKNELDITETEAAVLMASTRLNDNLQIVLDSIVDYKLNNNISAKLSNTEIHNLVVEGVNNTSGISEEVRQKVINKSNTYKQDVSDFLYDIDVNLIG